MPMYKLVCRLGRIAPDALRLSSLHINSLHSQLRNNTIIHEQTI